MTAPRILLWDIETSPSLGWVWEKWDTNVLSFEAEWYILSVAWKWLGESRVHAKGLPDFPSYRRNPTSDKALCGTIHELLSEADVVVAHNGNKFDQPKARARLLVNGFDPPQPFREVDTCQVAKRHFNFTSNKLGDLCTQLGIGGKEETGGFATWLGCMSGDEAAWKRMLRYNKQDVRLLEALYLRLRPWIERHPHVGLMADDADACPKCGGGPLTCQGFRYYGVTKRQRYQCRACGGWCQGRTMVKSDVRYTA